jgi:hypothetical protein
MPRGRSPLTEKQERILVQAQLMGLTTADMVKIGNRLRALDTEREFKQRVDEVTARCQYEIVDKNNFKIVDAKGLIYEIKSVKSGSKRYDPWPHRSYDVTVSHPGTRMQPKVAKGITINLDHYALPKMCPNQNKVLWSLLLAVVDGEILKRCK